MPEQQTTPNPAQQYRNRLIAAIRDQEGEISTLKTTIAQMATDNGVLTQAVQVLVTAAGADKHQRFASLMALAGDTDAAPATTTEQARTPDATDDPTSKGAAPAAANTEVTPAATTDVTTDAVALPVTSPLDNLQDVTAPVSGTDAVDPSAVFNGDISIGTGSNDSMSETPSGWTGTPGSTNRSTASQQDNEIERFTASMRLARLQIALGQAQGEDLTVAATITASDWPLSQINAVAQSLAPIVAQAAQRQPTTAQRRLVPQAAPGSAGITPSFQQQPDGPTQVVGSRGDDEWAFGMGGITTPEGLN